MGSNKNFDFQVPKLGEAKIKSPIKMSTEKGEATAAYVKDDEYVFFDIDAKMVGEQTELIMDDVLQLAGPRENIYFNPSHVHAAIATCGGLCPGLNNVIRALVRCLWYSYGVRRISGIQYGYRGLLPEANFPPIPLDPDVVDDIQVKGGTILGAARGGGDRVEEIVDSLERMNINMLFTVGGDGTLRGSDEIGDEIKKRGLKIAVIGIPKTIDNDLSFIQSSFGFDSAVSMAVQVVRGAHVEAHDSINGIGLVKVMGRDSGFIAAHTALAMSDVNFCMIPEDPFEMEGPKGLLSNLKRRISDRSHAVILVAEGAGQHLLKDKPAEKDASGNAKYVDIGTYLRDEITKFFRAEKIEVNMKYIDPSYIIRSAPANPNDSIYCSRLGAHAVHAAMTGKTQTLISLVNNKFVHIPIKVAVSARNKVNTEGSLWRDVLENTRQPVHMRNE